LVGRAGQGSAEAGPLRQAIESRHLSSFVLWGPPGVGKTTQRIYAIPWRGSSSWQCQRC
jgi:hypothetical protein